MIEVGFSIEGASEIDAILKELPFVMRKKVVASAVRSGAGIIRKEAATLAPRSSRRRAGRHLADEIIVRKKRRTNDIYEVGPSNAVPHAHLVEFGTGPRRFKEPRKVNIGGEWVIVEHTGQMPASPFLRPAVDNKGQAAIDKIGERLFVGIEREAGKLAGRYFDSGLRPRKRKTRYAKRFL